MVSYSRLFYFPPPPILLLHGMEYTQFWSCCILLGVWLGGNVYKESSHSLRLSSYHIWTTYFLNFFSQPFDIGQTYCSLSRFCHLSCNLDFFERMLCPLDNYFDYRHYRWILPGVVGNGWFLSLHCMDGGSWSWGTAQWKDWIVNLCKY